jgi:hypothetical protein
MIWFCSYMISSWFISVFESIATIWELFVTLDAIQMYFLKNLANALHSIKSADMRNLSMRGTKLLFMKVHGMPGSH